jgi:SPP1 family predicted phage head-tail adaptor
VLKGISNIGELDRRVVIQTVSYTVDDETNARIPTYSTYATVWAKRLRQKSEEDYEAKQLPAVKTQRYFIRYATGINERMLLVDGAETFKIRGIEQGPERKSYLILTVEKRDGE